MFYTKKQKVHPNGEETTYEIKTWVSVLLFIVMGCIVVFDDSIVIKTIAGMMAFSWLKQAFYG